MESWQENRQTISMIAGFVNRLPKSSPPKLGRPGARKEKLTKNCKEKDNKFYYNILMVMNVYSAFSIDIFKCALQASYLWVRSDISIYRRRLQPLSVH